MRSTRSPKSIAKKAIAGILAAATVWTGVPSTSFAQDRLPWDTREPAPRDARPYDQREEDERQPPPSYGEPTPRYSTPAPPPPAPAYDRPGYAGRDDAYRPPATAPGRDDAYRPQGAAPYRDRDDAYRPPAGPQYGAPYNPPGEPPYRERGYDQGTYRYDPPPPPRRYADDHPRDGTFSMREILDTGHGFFGSVSQGLASVIEHAFKRQGRPNGYILGEDLGGAFVAGLRYGEGTLYTRDAGNHKVFWQGPSVGYDAGAEGSKVMVLVYNLRDPSEIYERFGGVAGSAYVVGGVGLTFQSNNHVVLAPIRSGIGLRLGANIGYLKYTRRPTWNPF